MSAAAVVALGMAVQLAAAPVARPAPRVALRTRVERAVAQALRNDGLKHATWAIEVRSLATGRVLYARHADLSVMPASSLKLATTAAALDAFGPNARFRTTVQTAAPDNAFGRLLGDLYLVGSGDPSLSRELATRPDFGAFELLVDALHQSGLRRIEGRLIGVDALFPGERRGSDWVWEDLVWWYGAEVSALTFADGSLHLKLIPGAVPGAPVVLERHPATDYVRVDSKVETCRLVEPDPGLTVKRPFGRNAVELTGCLPVGSPTVERWLAVEDPAAYATAVFADALRAKGIELTGGTATTSELPAGLRTVAAYEGAPMSEVLKDVNKPSHNLRAEMLLRLAGAKVTGDGSVEAGRQVVGAFLAAQKVDAAGWDVQDGSGLSRSDLVTAHGLVDLLAAMDRHPHAAAFRDSLPVAGVDGTLKRRLSAPRTRAHIQAKTGTLRHTSALAGYAAPPRGERLAFAILVNHATATGGEIQEAIDKVAEALFGP
jgi:serine-type D-Ala-D-Ala carboxypeptidase/endopeptidase (penicillin-binding protein 4)